MLPKTAGLGGGQSISGLQRYLSSGGRDDRQQQPKEKSLKGHAVVIESRAGSKQWIALGLLVAAHAGFAACFWREQAIAIGDFGGFIGLGILVSQPMLCAFWAAFGPQPCFSRLLCSFLLCPDLVCRGSRSIAEYAFGHRDAHDWAVGDSCRRNRSPVDGTMDIPLAGHSHHRQRRPFRLPRKSIRRQAPAHSHYDYRCRLRTSSVVGHYDSSPESPAFALSWQ